MLILCVNSLPLCGCWRSRFGRTRSNSALYAEIYLKLVVILTIGQLETNWINIIVSEYLNFTVLLWLVVIEFRMRSFASIHLYYDVSYVCINWFWNFALSVVMLYNRLLCKDTSTNKYYQQTVDTVVILT